jgi:hypothetical protein
MMANNAYSQCGVYPKFDIEQNGGVTVAFNPTQTTLDVNWKITKYKWLVNDVAKDSGSILSPVPYAYFLPMGYSKVDLILWGTDTITNDSCSAQYGNIFHSTGNTMFPEMAVSCTGMDVTVTPHYLGDPNTLVSASVDWGDGSMPDNGSIGGFFHTYSAAGDYNVYVSLSDNIGNLASDNRKVHVNNGLTNYSLTGNSAGTGCNTAFAGYMNVYPSPASNIGSYEVINSAIGIAYGNFTLNTSLNVNLSGALPGQYIVRTLFNDPNGFYPLSSLSSVTKSVCGIEMDTIHGLVYKDDDYDGVKDTGEVGLVNVNVYFNSNNTQSNFSVKTDSSGLFSLVIPRDVVSVSIQYNTSAYTLISPSTNSVSINNSAGGSTAFVQFGLAPLSVNVSGKVFYDFNGNNTFDAGDMNVQTVSVKASSTQTSYTASAFLTNTGNYNFSLPAGPYKLTVEDAMIDSVSSTPDSIMVNAVSGTYANNNFYLNTSIHTDFDISLLAFDPRPGFASTVEIQVRQTGKDSSSGIVILTYDTSLTVGSVYPPYGLINSTAHTVTWPSSKIEMGGRRYFRMTYTPATTVPLGTHYSFSGSITADVAYTEYHLSNNTVNDMVIVIGSFDPNDKSVHPEGANGVGEVLHDTRLHYHINFQNTGTASAINVVVQDQLSQYLDLNTFVKEFSSHTCTYKIINNDLTFQFYNINLPDSNSNEPLSHGYVDFSIKPKQGLPDGTVISNEAAIYFDFNAPVITNTVVNTLQSVITSVNSNDQYNSISAYPVPVNDVLHLVSNSPMSGKVLVKVFSADGKLIDEIIANPNTSNSFDINFAKYEKGFYVVELLNNERASQVKVVK